MNNTIQKLEKIKRQFKKIVTEDIASQDIYLRVIIKSIENNLEDLIIKLKGESNEENTNQNQTR